MKNESKLDRVIRLILALVLLYLAFYIFAGRASLILYVLAVGMIITVITGFCSLYLIFGIDTTKKD